MEYSSDLFLKSWHCECSEKGMSRFGQFLVAFLCGNARSRTFSKSTHVKFLRPASSVSRTFLASYSVGKNCVVQERKDPGTEKCKSK